MRIILYSLILAVTWFIPIWSNLLPGEPFYELQTKFEDEVYIFSNAPESVSSPGLIFKEILTKNRLRVFYHHDNITDEPLLMTLTLSNLSKNPATIWLNQGAGGPSKDVIYVGHQAAKSFFESLQNEEKKIVLPGYSTKDIVIHSIKPSQISSGILKIEKESGSTLEIKMAIKDPDYPHLSGVVSNEGLFDALRFQTSARVIEKEFNISEKMTSFSIGGPPYLKDQDKQQELVGNYGVMYFVHVAIQNEFFIPKQVRVFFSPTKENGVDRGVMVYNNQLKETGILNFKKGVLQSEKIDDLILRPQESRDLWFVMMPQAGCFYPIDIVLRAME